MKDPSTYLFIIILLSLLLRNAILALAFSLLTYAISGNTFYGTQISVPGISIGLLRCFFTANDEGIYVNSQISTLNLNNRFDPQSET